MNVNMLLWLTYSSVELCVCVVVFFGTTGVSVVTVTFVCALSVCFLLVTNKVESNSNTYNLVRPKLQKIRYYK